MEPFKLAPDRLHSAHPGMGTLYLTPNYYQSHQEGGERISRTAYIDMQKVGCALIQDV